MMGGGLPAEAAKNDAREVGITLEGGGQRADGDVGGRVRGIAVDAGGYGREADGAKAPRARQGQGADIGAGEQLGLTRPPTPPHRAHGMNDMPGLEPIAPRDLGLARPATAERTALGHKLRAGSAMDGAVDPASAEQRRVGRID